MKTVVSGSTGLIGRPLVASLREAGHDVVRLVRRDPQGPDEVQWSPSDGTIDTDGLDGAEAVFHLAGAGIGDKRWTDSYKKQILDSRVLGTELLASTLSELDPGPSVMVSASAIGWYGDRGDEILDESAPQGDGFLADAVAAWEAAAQPAADAGIRVVHPRTGIVLSSTSLVIGRLLLPFKLGAGGRMGWGDQWWSWIALDDVVRAMTYLAFLSELAGPVNLTSPNPVTNREFVDTFGSVLRRPTVIPTPSLAIKSILGSELAEALVFHSQRVVPARLIEDGFEFELPNLREGLQSAVA